MKQDIQPIAVQENAWMWIKIYYKVLSINKILMSIKGHDSVKIDQN